MRLAYEGYDRAGKAVAGVVDAADANDAAENLRRQGLFVTRTTEADESAAADNAPTPARRASRRGGSLKGLAMFTRQLHVLVSTGTPLAQALAAQERQIKDEAWRQMLAALRTRVEEGASLSQAMEDHPKFFTPVYRSLITAGESAGNLPAMLDRLATLVRKQLSVRSNVIGAMVYPLLLLTVSVGVLIVMFTFVVPRFAELFTSLSVPLPPTTRMMMGISWFLRTYWWAMLIAMALAGAGAKFWLATAHGRLTLHTLSIRAPLIGSMMRNFATARITRLLGVLLDSEVPLLEALELTEQSLANTHYRNLIARARDCITEGDSVSTAFADERLISPSVYEAVRHGEQSGEMGSLMLLMADFLDEENDTVVRALTSILEPAILILLGGVVAFVALSIFIPLFDLTAMTGGGG